MSPSARSPVDDRAPRRDAAPWRRRARGPCGKGAVPVAQTGELGSPSLVELATDRLRHEILSGALPPGSRLVEEQVRVRLGISRAPLREALRHLDEQGLVEHLPRRGVRVASLSDRDVEELFDVRDVLERHAVTLALPL